MTGPINWNNRITPSRMPKGKPVVQLGSTEAVIDALPDGGVLLLARYDDKINFKNLRGRDVTIIGVSGAGDLLRAISPDKTVGVAPDAYRGAFSSLMWEDIARLIRSRFKSVIWG